MCENSVLYKKDIIVIIFIYYEILITYIIVLNIIKFNLNFYLIIIISIKNNLKNHLY